MSPFHTHTHSLALPFQFSPLSFTHLFLAPVFCLSFSATSFSVPPPPSLPFSLFAPILISALSIVGSAHPTHAHGLNEILYVRDPCMQLWLCKYDIFCIANTCDHKNKCACVRACVEEGLCASSHKPAQYSQMQFPQCEKSRLDVHHSIGYSLSVQ